MEKVHKQIWMATIKNQQGLKDIKIKFCPKSRLVVFKTLLSAENIIQKEINQMTLESSGRQAKIVNTLTVFDAETLFQKCLKDGGGTSEENPYTNYSPNEYVFMVASYGDAIDGNASANLNLKAVKSDDIRWRATSISDNSENSYNVEFYKFKQTSSGDSLFYGSPEKKGDFWEVTVKQKGTESYNWFFKITNADHKTCYFAWDPTITVE